MVSLTITLHQRYDLKIKINTFFQMHTFKNVIEDLL